MSRQLARLPRDLHPVAWWVWALGLGVAATLTTNPLVPALLIAVAAVTVAARRSAQPWGGSFGLYLWLGLVIVLVRVAFRVVFGSGPGQVWLDLPQIPLPSWVAGVRLLGPVTRESFLAGLYDGLRLATIVICVGAANSLANPKRLLKSAPAAFHEIGTALVVAVTVLPELASSVRRVRAAQELRGGPQGRLRGLRRMVVPVLEDALDHALALAAGMDVRGYGRAGSASARERAVTGTLMLASLTGIVVGTYAVLDQTAPRWLALPMIVIGVVLAALGLLSAGRRVEATRYRPDRWQWPEFCVMAGGVLAAALATRIGLSAYPDPAATPTLPLLALVGAALALIGGLAAPEPEVVA